jgi:ABC-type uncharacterized transport system auxiliary subunit
LLALIAGGCAGGGTYDKQHYILEAARPGEAIGPPIAGSLEVHRFSVDTAFATRGLVYRLGEFKYETDAYRQFLIAPGTMITERTRAWLADSGLFARVLAVGSRVAPDYTLEASVTALYGDFSDESAPAAVMEIRFFLLENTDSAETVAFAQTYRAVTPVRDRTAEIFVEALNRSLADILARLEADLQEALAGRADVHETTGS